MNQSSHNIVTENCFCTDHSQENKKNRKGDQVQACFINS